MDNWVYEMFEEVNGRGRKRWAVYAHIPMTLVPRWVGAFDTRAEAEAHVSENTWKRVDG